MYSIEFTKKANNFFQRLPKQDKLIISKKLNSITINPLRYLKRLTGSKLYRLRVLKYRAIIDVVVSNSKIIVLRIGYRKNIYSK